MFLNHNIFITTKDQARSLHHGEVLRSLVAPYKRKRLKAERQETKTIAMEAKKALETPKTIWLQNLPNILHTFIHCRSSSPSLAIIPDSAVAAMAATLKYAIACSFKSHHYIATTLLNANKTSSPRFNFECKQHSYLSYSILISNQTHLMLGDFSTKYPTFSLI